MRLVPALIESLAAWATLVTALGTALLAVATFVLSQKTSREVEAATAQAKASGQQAAESARQAGAAERALLAQTRPLLSDVPWGLAERVTGYVTRSGASRLDQATTARTEDASIIHVSLTDSGDGHLRVPFRNVGNGAAIIQRVAFVVLPGVRAPGECSTPVVPPGEFAEATLAVGADSPWRASAAEINSGLRSSFSVVVGYADAEGSPRGGVRFDVHKSDFSGAWRLRQVFWGEDAETALVQPSFGSQEGA